MDRQKSQQFMRKVVGDVATAMAGALISVGDQTGLFAAMAGGGPLDADEVAARSGVRRRYVEEWLSAMVCAGYVEYDAANGRYTLPDEHALFFADRSSEYYLGGLFASLPGLTAMVPRLCEAFASGEGVAFGDFGADMPLALEQLNRNVYERRLVDSWLATMPEVVERLSGGGRAIDVGCGTGVVPITLAKAFPRATIEGLDLDARSIAIARENARNAGVGDAVRFIQDSAEAIADEPLYDLVTTFDTVHDLPDPLGTLRSIRRALKPGGTYLMVEPKIEDRLEDNVGNPFGRMLYSISCLHCVPQSLAQGGPGLGACWGPTRARELANRAGFGQFETLPAQSPVMAFYAIRA